jgi:virginiamycin A acetyltransferase
MQILTEKNVVGIDKQCADAQHFTVIRYADGNVSTIPHGLFRNNHDEDIFGRDFGRFHIGRDSGLGVGSIAKYDGNRQSLLIGRHVRGGLRLRFLLNGQHETRSLAMSLFSFQIPVLPTPQYGDTVVRNDIWIGDEAMVLGGSTIENGCVIGARSLLTPNFQTEPFGIYLGTPARLTGFRFSERVREALLRLSWWDQPFDWVRAQAAAFAVDLTEDEGRSLDLLAALQSAKEAAVASPDAAVQGGPDAGTDTARSAAG